jgi:hypothetical protein
MKRTKRMLGSGAVEGTKRMLGSGAVEGTKRMLGSGARGARDEPGVSTWESARRGAR